MSCATQEMVHDCHPDPLRVAAYSTCPSGLWHERIAPLLAAPEMVMLNIGANKGYNLLEFAQRYTSTPANLTHASWYRLLMNHGCQTQCCGVCALCRATRMKQQANAKLHLHAFELQHANALMLQRMVNITGLPVSVHSTAVSNISGTVYTASEVKPGSESIGIARRHARNVVARPVTTVDAFMAIHGITRAHFVSVDTEGLPARPFMPSPSLIAPLSSAIVQIVSVLWAQVRIRWCCRAWSVHCPNDALTCLNLSTIASGRQFCKIHDQWHPW